MEKNEEQAYQIYRHCLELLEEDDKVGGPVHLRLGKMYLEGIGTGEDPERALFEFRIAERLLFEMIRGGDYMYKRSLREAVDGQNMARKKLEEELPSEEWTFDD